MTFRQATDEARQIGLTLGSIAQQMGMTANTFLRMRMSQRSTSARRPPDGWRVAMAQALRIRAGRLINLAHRLEDE